MRDKAEVKSRGVAKRPLGLYAAQAGMFVFVVVLAWNAHPYIVKYNGTLVSVLSFFIILGLLMLPGWLFKRQQRLTSKPSRSTIVKVHKSLLLPNGDELFVTSRGIGPMAGFKGFQTIAVHAPQAPPLSPRRSVWDILRWTVVFPAAAIVYILVAVLLVPLFGALPHLPEQLGYFLVFVVSALAGVLTGSLIAPTHRAWVAGVLTLLLAGVLTFFALTFQGNGTEASAVRQSILLQLVAALLVVYTFWRAGRRAARARP
ncbi:hypothetical protein [Deinococcus sp. UYEF24]